MNKFWLFLFSCLLNFPASAQEVAADMHLDDLNDSAEIRPVERVLSDAERHQENSSDLSYIENETPRPELLCSDENLMMQIKNFIYEFEQQKISTSVQERRARILLVKNLHDFREVTEKDLKGNFEASAAAANLKINEKREIYRICASSDNKSKKFKNTYIIIYPYIDSYKVVITNLLALPEKMDDATFIYKR